MDEVRAILGDLPAVLLAPGRPAGLVLWLSHLGGSAAKERPTMLRIVEAGWAVASFDAPLHGARATTDDPRAFASEVLASFRQRMWPILGQASLEAMRVISWAQHELGERDRPVAAGGVSMGGDIAVTLAGIDDRVNRVAAIGSTPNWRRPDMRSLADPTQVIEQGPADRYAQWFADQLDPSQHLERYRPGLRISFEHGGEDHHIPVANAERFRSELLANGAEVVVTVHPGLNHFGVTTDQGALSAAVAELTE